MAGDGVDLAPGAPIPGRFNYAPSTPFQATQQNATNLGGGFPIGPSSGSGLNNSVMTGISPRDYTPAQSGYGSFGGGSSGFGGGANDAAVATQSADYDRIMQGYKDLLGPNSRVNAETIDYHQSVPSQRSLSILGDLAETGGYNAQGLQDIRERSIAPIRSVYANAQRNLDRQRSLSGGNTANYGALTSRMARESADLIGGATTRVNADVAQNVAQNKLSIAPSYSSAAQNEQNARMQVEQHNQDILNQISMFNASMKQNALGGMRDLYGTTPALIDTFGRQALGSRGLDIQEGSQRNSQQLELLRSILSSAGSI